MSPVARAYHSSDRVITGSERSTGPTLDMGMTSSFMTRGERGGDPSGELLSQKPFARENVREQCRSEPAPGQGDRVQSNGDVVRRRHLGDDRREPADGKVVLHRDDHARLADRSEDGRLV